MCNRYCARDDSDKSSDDRSLGLLVGKLKRRRKKNNGITTTGVAGGGGRGGGGGSFFQLSFSLILLLWCLVFLFYSRLGLSHENGEDLTIHGGRADRAYSEVVNGSNTNRNAMVLEFGLAANNQSSSPLPSNQSSSNVNKDFANRNCSSPLTNRLEEVIWNALYRGTLSGLRDAGKSDTNSEKELPSGKAQHPTYLNFEEFRNITRSEKDQTVSGRLVNITHRLETDGKEYNYASATKGAKVVAHNKEAKGAGNILGKDHDKYLRNPCSVGGKFVVIELSEETLVDVVKIANFEHYSSNFKEFELFGSLNYPTETWTTIGKFVAANVKQIQNFKLLEPTWVRYLNLSLLSHYGSEFYCTLSVVEVYGVDAIERMLEDLFVTPEEPAPKQLPVPNSTETPPSKKESSSSPEGQSGKVQNKAGNGKSGAEDVEESQRLSEKVPKNPVNEMKIPDPVTEVKQQPISRVPGDTVLKILMQKVRSLELNLAMLEEYIKQLNRMQGDVFPELDKELSKMSALLEKSKTEIRDLMEWKANVEKALVELDAVKAVVSSRLDTLVTENIKLRLDVDKVVHDQANMENKELAVLAVSFFFMCCALIKLVSARVSTLLGSQQSDKVSRPSRGWVMILVSSTMTMFITLLSG